MAKSGVGTAAKPRIRVRKQAGAKLCKSCDWPEATACEDLSAAYRQALDGKVLQLRALHFEGVLRPALQDDEVELIHAWPDGADGDPGGADSDRVREVLALVSRYERELGAVPKPARTIESSFPAGLRPASRLSSAMPAFNEEGETRGLTPAGSPGVFRKTGEVVELAIEDCATLAANPVPEAAAVETIAEAFRWRGQDEPIVVLERARVPAEIAVSLRPKQRDYLYLVLAGATRLAAAGKCGWSQIQARVRDQQMSAEEILGFAFRNNTDRRTVTTAERAGYAAALAETLSGTLPEGASVDEAVGQQMGLDRAEVNQLRRFGQLPAVWQDRVSRFERDRDDTEGISWSAAKALLSEGGQLPGVLTRLEEIWSDEWARAEHRSKDAFRELVRDCVVDSTRPIDKGKKHHYGYQSGGMQERLYPLTDELTEQLGVITLRYKDHDGKEVVERRATNVALNDELQQPYLAKIVVAKHNGTPTGSTRSKPKAADERKSSPAELAREEAARAKEQDRELSERIQRAGGLREQAVRYAIAKRIEVQRELGLGVFHSLLVSAGCNQVDWRDWQEEAILGVKPRKKPKAVGSLTWREEDHLLAASYGEEVGNWSIAAQSIQVEIARLIVFPWLQSGESQRCAVGAEWPTRWPWIPQQVLSYWAGLLGASVQDTWTAATHRDCAARVWFETFLKSHSSFRQIMALAKEARREWELQGCKTATEGRARLVKSHEEQPLPLPRVLMFEEAKPKRKGKS